MKSPKFWALLSLVFAVVLMRFLPHPSNFSPVAAVALFAGAKFAKPWLAFAVPFLAMFLSDAVIGFHDTMWAVYLSFGLVVTLGFWMREKANTQKIILSSLVGSSLFFLITNFAVWLTSGMYSMNMMGLISCYTAALPFFDNSVLGDLTFSAIIFGVWSVVESRLNVKKVSCGR